MMDKIVFLDAATVQWGDVSLGPLEKLGKFKAYGTTSHSKISERVKGARTVITNKCRFDAALLEKLETVTSIHIAATGVNNIDLRAAKAKKIAVTNVSGYSTESVVQATFAFLLALAGSLIPYHHAAHDGTWSRSPHFTLGLYPIREVYGKTLGLVGYGAIGKRVADVARAFGMKVLIAKIPGKKYAKKGSVRRVSFEKMLRRADVVSLHCPLTPLTQHLINQAAIGKMKKGAFLLNMARGGIVDEKALRRALERGQLAGAASDVLTQEPPPKNHVLLGAPNFLLTPHVAWANRESRQRLIQEIALNIRAFRQGRLRNRVV